MEQNHKHFDPPRYPKLILPIEEEMKKNFVVTTKKMLVDLTTQLTKEAKKK